MEENSLTLNKYFKIIGSGNAYLNMLYLLLSFPLGIFYFVYLVTGLSVSISLIIIWVGIPLLLLVGAGWWFLAVFERQMAVKWLGEDIPPMTNPPAETEQDLWERFKAYLTNPVTWKSVLYLFLKFPLGIFSFVVLVTLASLTLSLVLMPFTYQIFGSAVVQIDFGDVLWGIDSFVDAAAATVIGIFLWPASLWAFKGITWVHAKLALLLLGNPQTQAVQVEASDEND